VARPLTRRGRLGHSALREEVHAANMALARSGLVMGTFGNVSGIDRAAGLMAIKPSGVPYDRLSPREIVLVALEDGAIVDSALRPSSDAPTHLVLYRAFPSCGGVVHTHSQNATALAQAGLPVRCLGTTHADHFRGDVPVTRPLDANEVAGEYEKNTGLVIVETFRNRGLAPEEVAAVLVVNHGPFTWGATAQAAVESAEILEYLAAMEIRILASAPEVKRPAAFLVDKHYLRKHGSGAYYGQPAPADSPGTVHRRAPRRGRRG
jgi:L-ribulose-5-phosphate 4-epimerase